MKKFTPEEDAFITANRLLIPQKRMAKMLGRADSVVRQRLARLGLSVPKEIAQLFAMDSRIKPGNIPANKGMGMSAEVRKKVKHTWFKKGHLPPNTKEDGVITIRTDTKTGIKYKYIRIKKAKWIPYHRYKWEKLRGKVKRGWIVVFKDRNQMNCKIGNLELITKAENMKRNTIHNLPPEVKKGKQLLAGFNRKLNHYVKNH